MRRARSIGLVFVLGAIVLSAACGRELAGSYRASFDETTASEGSAPMKDAGAFVVRILPGEAGVLVTFEGGTLLADSCAIDAKPEPTSTNRVVFETGKTCRVTTAAGDVVTLRVTGGGVERGVGGKMSGTVVGDLWGMPGFPANTPSARYSLSFSSP